MDRVLPLCDFVFGNETEAKTFSEVMEWGTTDIKEIAAKLQALPGKEGKTVVITQARRRPLPPSLLLLPPACLPAACLPATHCRLLPACLLPPAARCRCRLPPAARRLPAACCRPLPAASCLPAACCLPPASCLLPAASCCLLSPHKPQKTQKT